MANNGEHRERKVKFFIEKRKNAAKAPWQCPVEGLEYGCNPLKTNIILDGMR